MISDPIPIPVPDSASQRALQLLYERLSSGQRKEFLKIREVPIARGYEVHWFNVVGSVGGHYCVAGFFHPCDQIPYGRVALGFDAHRPGWCVSARSVQSSRMPTADEMLSFKLALEVDEIAFLARAVPTSLSTQVLHERREQEIGAAVFGGAI